VVDLGLALAGPYGTALLADLGADVIKVNAPWDGPWLSTRMGQMANSGKRSVLLHLGQPHGLAAAHRLMETADIVTHNMRWGVADRIGIGYEEASRRNPSVIYCQSRGFDRARSASNVPGTDQSGSALAGQEWEDGGCWRGGRPFFGTSFGDLGNGFLVAIACVQALYHRDRTGEGQLIGTSILNACLLTSSGTFAFPDGSGPERPRLDGLQLGFNSLYRLYETAEGWLCLAAVTPSHWDRLCHVLGRPELVTDPRFADLAGRTANDDELGKYLEESFAGRTAQEWFTALDAAGVPVEVSVPRFVPPTADKPFLNFSSTPASVPRDAPELGAHTRDVLGETELSVEEIEAVCAESETIARSI
jgi:crotonobetainyl-CoA:carnitine CoA-transferase CaiB-like acyl-CoA transferase